MTPWTRYDCEGGACIETRVEGDTVIIRDSEAPWDDLEVPAASWEAFLAAVRAPVEAELATERAVHQRTLSDFGATEAKLERLGRDYVRVMTERDKALAAMEQAQADRDRIQQVAAAKTAAEFERNAMRPVLDAARALLLMKDGPRDAWCEAAKPAAWQALRDTLDGVSPEGTARPPYATEAAPQAPDVAQGTDGLEAHRGAEEAQGGPVAPGQIYLVGEAVDG